MSYIGPDPPYTPSDLTSADLHVAGRDAASPRVSTTAGWIVCRGGERLTSGGLVACPVGQAVPIDDCLACRFLETVEDERDAAYSCATEASADYSPAASACDHAPSSSDELALALLQRRRSDSRKRALGGRSLPSADPPFRGGDI